MHTVHLYLILAKEKKNLIYCIYFLNVLNKAIVPVMNASVYLLHLEAISTEKRKNTETQTKSLTS